MKLLVLLLLSFGAVAQYHVRHLTARDGLSQGSVYYVLKDSRGFVWMSSQNGLNRFDGQRFRVFLSAEKDSVSIGPGEVRGLVETPAGDLWLGSDCLNRYDRRRDAFERVYATDSAGHRVLTAHLVIGADSATVWYVNAVEGIVAYQVRTRRKQRLLPFPQFRYGILTELAWFRPAQRDLFLLLGRGLLRYELRTGRVSHYFTPRPDDAVGRAELLTSVFFSRDGTGWLGAGSGLIRFSPENPRAARVFPLPVDAREFPLFSLAEAPDGRLWVGTGGAGVLVFDPRRGSVTERLTHQALKPNSLAYNNVSEIYFDPEGLAWVNADPLGVDVVYPQAYHIERFADNPLDPQDLNNQAVRALVEDHDGQVWIGTVEGGVRRYNPRTGTMRAFTTADGLTQNRTRPILRDSRGTIWVGTHGGLCRFDSLRQRFDPLPNPANPADPENSNSIRGLLELPDRSLLVATLAGLYRLPPPYREFTLVASAVEPFTGPMHFEAATGLLYAGIKGTELRCYRYQNGTLRLRYRTLPGHNPLAFRPDSLRACLWICTSKGLVRFDTRRGRVIRHFKPADGLSHEVVYGMLPDRRGRYWLSTNQGLTRFDPRTNRFSPVPASRHREYNIFSTLLHSDGTMYFGSVNGLEHFSPDGLERPTSARVQLTQLLLNDEPATPDTAVGEARLLRLKPSENTFTIGFVALDYLGEGRNLYQYRLRGLDADWTPPGPEGSARYARVEAGTYQFEVRALDSGGNWTPVRGLTIVVEAPFWQRPGFLVLVAGSLGLLGFALVRVYLHSRLRAQQRLTRRVVNAQEDERRRIARDLHDDVGNALAAARSLLAHLSAEGGSADRIETAQQLVEKAGQGLRTVTHDLMPVEFERYALGEVLRQLVEKAGASSAIRFEYLQAGALRKQAPDRELVVYRIASELITNVLKHSGAALAVVQLFYQPDLLVLSVEDNGIGDRAVKNVSGTGGIGLKNVTSRCQFLAARLSYHADESGTHVFIEIPYGPHPRPPRG